MMEKPLIDQEANEADEKSQVVEASASDNQVTTVKHSVTVDIDVCKMNKQNKTVLQYSVNKDHLDLLKILVQAGDNVSPNEVYDKPLLHAAATAGKIYNSTIKLLLSLGINVNERDEFGRSLLHYVAIFSENDSHLSTADLLLHKGADLLVKDNDGRTPIDYLFGPENQRKNPYVKFLFVHQMSLKKNNSLKIWIDDHEGTLSQYDSAIKKNVEKKMKLVNKLDNFFGFLFGAIFFIVLLIVEYIILKQLNLI